jgi:hypothetical protein
MAHLVMSCNCPNEMDVFLQVEKLRSDKWRQGVTSIPYTVRRDACIVQIHAWLADWY